MKKELDYYKSVCAIFLRVLEKLKKENEELEKEPILNVKSCVMQYGLK